MITFVAGPCVVESPALTSTIAQALKTETSRFPEISFIFKASFDKANRTSHQSFRNLGKEYALEILQSIKKEYNIPITTDVHSPEDIKNVCDFVDVIQIPAFLGRQTDLLLAAGESNKVVNIKKPQFCSPSDVKYIVDKVRSKSSKEVWVTERGTCFGYNNLVVDFRGFSEIEQHADRVILDISHSLQQPSLYGKSGSTPDARDIAPRMARAAMAYGVNGVFVETHPHPDKARCDGDTSLYLSHIPQLLEDITCCQKKLVKN